jgi:hypothetical protein
MQQKSGEMGGTRTAVSLVALVELVQLVGGNIDYAQGLRLDQSALALLQDVLFDQLNQWNQLN